jgi:hypothetical protein
MLLTTEPYLAQKARWPREGRHILAQYDATSIIVYQAFRPDIVRSAVTHGHFAEGFSLSRMSWIKPNFLWMMFRSGWAQKPDQEAIVAVRLLRSAFDAILGAAVQSSFVREIHGTEEAWKSAVASSDIRLQWDPDHDPRGQKVERRAIQIGLRGPTLARYASEWILGVEDVTDFVREQHANAGDHERLLLPREEVYPIADAAVAAKLGVSDNRGQER